MRLVIDTDPGIDDALALLYAWSSPETVVEAITTVAGNVPVDTATANVLRLLALRPPAHRPILAAGAHAPLVRALRTATHYHGEDGLGDLGDWPSVDISAVPGNATDVLVEHARHGAADLTLVALGPLTNLALAVRKDAEAVRRFTRVVAMGGAVDVAGNVTATAEFNVFVDPEAAAQVVDAGLRLDLVPLDATRQAVLERARLDALVDAAGDVVSARIARFTERGFRMDATHGARGMVLHDPLAIGVALDASFVEWEAVHLAVGRGGETHRISGTPNCRIARRVDVQRFVTSFLSRLIGTP